VVPRELLQVRIFEKKTEIGFALHWSDGRGGKIELPDRGAFRNPGVPEGEKGPFAKDENEDSGGRIVCNHAWEEWKRPWLFYKTFEDYPPIHIGEGDTILKEYRGLLIRNSKHTNQT